MKRQNRIKLRFACLALLALTATAFAQPDSLWSRRYGESGDAWGISALQTSDGGYLLAGNILLGINWDFYLVKTDANGDTLWTRAYGMGHYGGGGYVCAAQDGGYVIAGTLYSGYGRNFWLLKVTADGDSLWHRTFRGAGTDYCNGIALAADGGFLLAGEDSVAGRTRGFLLQTSSTGDSLQIWRNNAFPYSAYTAIRPTPDGGFILAGEMAYPYRTDTDFMLLKVDSLGSTVWQRTYGGSGDDFWPTVQPTVDGGYVMVGTTTSFGAGRQDVWLVRINADGDSVWSKTYGGAGKDQSHAVRVLPDGGFIIGAHSASFVAGSDVYWLLRTDANGDSLWSRTFLTGLGDWCNDVLATDDGGYAIFGGTSLLYQHQAMWLVKTGRDPVLSAVEGRTAVRPYKMDLANYPNPFNPSTWISFDLPRAGNVSLKVFDVLGREVTTLSDGRMSAGSHQILYDGKSFASGTYLVRLEAEGMAQSRKIMLLK